MIFYLVLTTIDQMTAVNKKIFYYLRDILFEY